ncbi:MAG TPA: hypothetical protein VGG45_12765 [Terracidiphilus sp.]
MNVQGSHGPIAVSNLNAPVVVNLKENIPQGLKPNQFGFIGTTEFMP